MDKKYRFVKIKEAIWVADKRVQQMEDISNKMAKDGYKLVFMFPVELLYLLVFEKVG